MSKRTEDLEKQIIALQAEKHREKILAGACRLRLDMKSAGKHAARAEELTVKINDRLDWINQLGV